MQEYIVLYGRESLQHFSEEKAISVVCMKMLLRYVLTYFVET